MRKELIELIGSKVCDEYSPSCDEYEPHTCENCYANDCKIEELADAILADGWTNPLYNVENIIPQQEVYKTIKVRPMTLKDLQERYCLNCKCWYGEKHNYESKSCERCMRAINNNEKLGSDVFENRNY